MNSCCRLSLKINNFDMFILAHFTRDLYSPKILDDYFHCSHVDLTFVNPPMVKRKINPIAQREKELRVIRHQGLLKLY